MEILAAIIVSLTIGALLGAVFSQERARVALWRDLGLLWAWMVTPVFAEQPGTGGICRQAPNLRGGRGCGEFGLGVR